MQASSKATFPTTEAAKARIELGPESYQEVRTYLIIKKFLPLFICTITYSIYF